jgi:translation initiation factor IF-2
MNVTELARKLRVNAQELRDKLPELGFDIGQKAIKIDDRLASRIINAWRDYEFRAKQKKEYDDLIQKDEKGEVILDKKVEIPSVLTVKDFSELLKLPVTKVIAELMKSGVMASMNQRIDFDTAAIVAADMGYEATEITVEQKVEVDKAQKLKDKLAAEDPAKASVRPPIVVVMGHVDHGKTKLLDAVRKTDVVAGEAGGITQHIGAYMVERQGKRITFIDTPGHEAFTAMRSRGAKVADIAILVVAATEGVKPQTIESIKIAQEAGIPILVAVNKVDLPDANPEKVKQELAQYNLMSEEWGGKTLFVEISAKFNKNIDGLLDNLLLLTEMNQETMKANPEGEFIGSIVEAHVDEGEGPVATVLVRNGTLHQGEYVMVDGVLYGKIRIMKDHHNDVIKIAGPSVPAKIQGLKVAPKVGDLLEVTDDPKKAKRAKAYAMAKHDESFIEHSTEEVDEDKLTKLNIILRSDVLGSQEAIIESLKKIETEDIKINFITNSLGNVTESDVLSAEATGALVLGFNVMPSSSAADLARDKKVEIKTYKVIYELIDEVKSQLKKIIKSELVREDLGKMEVLAIFKKNDKWQVLGGRVKSGRVEPGARVAVLRNEEFVTSGRITELQIGKEIVKDCVQGQECGLKFEGQPLIEVGDILDIYTEQEIKKQL